MPVTWPVWLLALGPLITPYIIARVFLLPRFPGRLAFVGLFIAGVWWIGAAWAELIAQTTADKVLCARFAWVGIMTAPAFWLLFVWSYVGSGRDRPPLSWMLIMAAAAVSMIVIVFTPSLQHLVYVRVTPNGPGPDATLVYTHGPVFYLATLYIYCCLAVTAFLILRAAAGARGVYRRHYLAFLGAVAIRVVVRWLRCLGALVSSGRTFQALQAAACGVWLGVEAESGPGQTGLRVAQRRRLKAMAAIITWPEAFARPM